MTNEQRMENLYWLEASREEVMLEGANWEVRRIFVEHRKNLKIACKEVRKAYKRGDYTTAKNRIADTKKIIDKMYKDISRIQKTGGIGSWIFGLISGDIMFIGRTLVGYLFAPLGNTIVTISKWIKRINVIIKDCNNEKRDLDSIDLNLYINGIKVRINEYKKILDNFERVIDEKEKSGIKKKKN